MIFNFLLEPIHFVFQFVDFVHKVSFNSNHFHVKVVEPVFDLLIPVGFVWWWNLTWYLFCSLSIYIIYVIYIYLLVDILRVRLNVTEMKCHPGIKKFLFTREFHHGMKRGAFHSGMKFNLKENLPLSMKTYNNIILAWCVKTSDDYPFRKKVRLLILLLRRFQTWLIIPF